jgi:hypothetical protein
LNFSLQVLGTVNPARPRSETNKSNDEIGDEGEESDEDQFFDVSPVSGAKTLEGVFYANFIRVQTLYDRYLQRRRRLVKKAITKKETGRRTVMRMSHS